MSAGSTWMRTNGNTNNKQIGGEYWKNVVDEISYVIFRYEVVEYGVGGLYFVGLGLMSKVHGLHSVEIMMQQRGHGLGELKI